MQAVAVVAELPGVQFATKLRTACFLHHAHTVSQGDDVRNSSTPCSEVQYLTLCHSLLAPTQDALSDRDLVHRQTAASVVQHMAMGVPGLGCEDALLHLLNYVWPNVFEDSPHLINGVMGAIDGCRLSLGPCVVLHYTLQVRGWGLGRAPCDA